MKQYADTFKFINHKFCAKNGLSPRLSPKEFTQKNKRYYQETENYDWVEVVDHFRGLEAILHRRREKEAVDLVKKFAVMNKQSLFSGENKQSLFSGENKFLDVGCGTGLILRHLPPGSVGLDINPRNIKLAKIHAPRAKLVLGDIENMPFPDKSFTTIICTDVLEHLPKPQKALSEIFRVLRPGGILIGSVPALNLIWRLRFLSSTHPGEPYHRLYKDWEVKSLFSQKYEILKFKKGCIFMNFFFVVKKTN